MGDSKARLDATVSNGYDGLREFKCRSEHISRNGEWYLRGIRMTAGERNKNFSIFLFSCFSS